VCVCVLVSQSLEEVAVCVLLICVLTQGASTSTTEPFGHRAKRARVSGRSHDLPGKNVCLGVLVNDVRCLHGSFYNCMDHLLILMESVCSGSSRAVPAAEASR
jgi:hypothetical protein